MFVLFGLFGRPVAVLYCGSFTQSHVQAHTYNATIPVSELDRGRADHRNIMTAIVSVDEKGFFRLGTRFGLLKTLFLRSMFQLCTDSGFIALDDVPLDKEISTREAATKESVGGQGFFAM